jgi:hypothetical protein
VIEVTTTVERKRLGKAATARPQTKPRLIVVAALATAVGSAALAALSIERADPAGVVVAVYIAVMALAIAPAIVAEIRDHASALGSLKLVQARAGEPLAVDESDDMLVIDASAADLRIELPKPSAFRDRMLTFERIDQTGHDVVLDPLGCSLGSADAELRLVVADGAWKVLDAR